MHKIYPKIFVFFLLILFSSADNFILKAKGNNETNPEISKSKVLSNELIQSHYIVDSGDTLYINFKDIAFFTKDYNVSINGEIYLPEIGLFSVKGLTTMEIKTLLQEKYKDYLINPIIEVWVSGYRPLNIYISGEVNRPGLYQLKYGPNNEEREFYKTQTNFNSLIDNQNSKSNLSSQTKPRLFDALQQVDGLTNKADLSNIQVTRKNSIPLGGGTVKANINLLKLLKNGDQSQNITLFDGDFIFIPASQNVMLDQIVDINRTNLNPRLIQVFVTGNVPRPGSTTLKQNSSLVEAIMAAGGKNSMAGNINFIRLQRDGKSDKRIFKFNESSEKGSYTNPILIDGDLIVLKRNLLGKASSIISEVGNPIVNSYGLYKIFKEVKD